MARKKITATTDNSEWKAPKKRKKRKPMTEKQRVAAAERLTKVRERKLVENPNYGKSNIHESLWNLPEDDKLHPTKVKKWIRTQKELAASERPSVRNKVKGAVARLAWHEGYISDMQRYLKHGDWSSNFYGEHQENKIRWRNVALGYYWSGPNKGKPKRNVGTFYPDLDMVWEKGMEE